MTKLDYWEECISSTFQDHGVSATPEQISAIAKDIEVGVDNIGMAFYSPPASDRLADIERGWKNKYARLEKEFSQYRSNAETAVKQALHQRSETHISIEKDGEVLRYSGRIEKIQ